MRNRLLEGFCTLDEFAKEVGRCRRTVDRWAKAGLVTDGRLGNLRVIDIKASRVRKNKNRPRRGK